MGRSRLDDQLRGGMARGLDQCLVELDSTLVGTDAVVRARRDEELLQWRVASQVGDRVGRPGPAGNGLNRRAEVLRRRRVGQVGGSGTFRRRSGSGTPFLFSAQMSG